MMTIQLPGERQPTLVQSIMWLEGQANYTKVHHQSGKAQMVTQSLLWFDRQLKFIRVHRSAIINPLYITGFWQKRGRAGCIRLVNGLMLRVSRSRLAYTADQLCQNGHQQLVYESVAKHHRVR